MLQYHLSLLPLVTSISLLLRMTLYNLLSSLQHNVSNSDVIQDDGMYIIVLPPKRSCADAHLPSPIRDIYGLLSYKAYDAY